MKSDEALIERLDLKYGLEKTLDRIKRYENVLAIIIFGSQAKGKATRLSDIDICVVLSDVNRNKALISTCGSDKMDISFFDELPIYMRYRVFKEGVLVYARDEAKLTGIMGNTLSEFMDFRSTLDEYFRIAYGWKYEI